uniref:Aminotransferase class I/classII domain-containing protein n=1 Tax=Chaetoceros debilis TaxID=122233 RepID=A0A7S3V843_9STRA|mmetsp:Transcript_22510/g.34325  ORF Transcript_22510/g.34325 Transcript_22510/m.34325 type:complete len:432 (+) Transcript_22510:151-1446(+)|eukprot:CAMPEP_0194077092 /NCGR_PEP_ID=MMETSP0149-20130528/3737_1 /TAXON_ID=122233 /ORGANISM="Chaetoceros debilis, Strain MM31A-1" /LENGTH=431 /DNA_ID=CAMNT_0038757995 /DNA_START=83 /DNA_END=1378 /DNA_ORIENTATION=-
MVRFTSAALILASAFTVNAFSAVPKTGTRTVINRDIKTPDPVPFEGQQEALSVMQSGKMYRYNIAAGEESIVSKCEIEITEYTGHKYCVALNSCGSALMLLLKTSGLEHGGKVISNAFTFGAVPSAIEHAGGKAVYVESDYNHVMDVPDLEKKLKENPDCKHVMVSHMRGKVADMNAIAELCEKYDAILLEDCAHSLGVRWEDKHTGHAGIACAISSQSYKMINSGEGGFFLTDDPLMAAKCAVYAGAYESLNGKHVTVPGPEVFGTLSNELPNYSVRMSNLAAAVIRPQIKTLDERIDLYNSRYNKLTASLEEKLGEYISIPVNTPGVSMPVHDSIQINLSQDFSDSEVEDILVECGDHGLAVELFGHKNNARNFVNWGFAPAEEPLPMTAKMLSRAIDCRMPLMWDDSDFEDMALVLSEAILAVVAKRS